MKFNPQPKKGIPPKKQRKPLKRSALKYKRKPTGERALFLEIANERGRVSQISGVYILPLLPENFMHVLAKGQNRFPKFKLYKKNILIVTADEHRKYDHGSQEALKKLSQWKWVFELREELIVEYRIKCANEMIGGIMEQQEIIRKKRKQ